MIFDTISLLHRQGRTEKRGGAYMCIESKGTVLALEKKDYQVVLDFITSSRDIISIPVVLPLKDEKFNFFVHWQLKL